MKGNPKARYLVLLSLLLTLSACRIESVLPVQPDNGPTYTGTLRIGLHGEMWKKEPYPPRGKVNTAGHLFQKKSEAFMEKYPGVTIEFVDVAYDRNFKAMLADPSQMPDIMELTVNEARWLMKDRIVSLAERIEDRADVWDGDYMKVVDLAEIGGEAYLLPITSDPMIVFYEHAVLAQEGIEPPREGWTLEDYMALGRTLQDRGYTLWHPPLPNEIEPFIHGLGGKFADGSGKIAGTLDSEATVQAFVRFADILNATSTAEQHMDRDAFERTAVRFARSTQLFVDHWKLSVAPLPDAPDGKRYNNSLLTGLAITSNAAQPDLAWAYMTFMLGESSDEAMDNVVTYTLETYGPDDRFQGTRDNPPSLQDTKQWMRYEITVSPPAAFDFVMEDGRGRDSTSPQRPFQPLYNYTNPDAARQDLALWAQEMESYVRQLEAAVAE